jgi:hypothetical protein
VRQPPPAGANAGEERGVSVAHKRSVLEVETGSEHDEARLERSRARRLCSIPSEAHVPPCAPKEARRRRAPPLNVKIIGADGKQGPSGHFPEPVAMPNIPVTYAPIGRDLSLGKACAPTRRDGYRPSAPAQRIIANRVREATTRLDWRLTAMRELIGLADLFMRVASRTSRRTAGSVPMLTQSASGRRSANTSSDVVGDVAQT